MEEIEALIKLLEVKNNKTLIEKNELKKLKKKRLNLKNYKDKKEHIRQKQAAYHKHKVQIRQSPLQAVLPNNNNAPEDVFQAVLPNNNNAPEDVF